MQADLSPQYALYYVAKRGCLKTNSSSRDKIVDSNIDVLMLEKRIMKIHL